MKCTLAAGVSIYKTSKSEVVASGNSMTVMLDGPAHILLQFLESFSDDKYAEIDYAIDNVVRSSIHSGPDAREIVDGLREVANRLLGTGILVAKEMSSKKHKFKSALFLAHEYSTGIAYLKEAFPSEVTEVCLVGKNPESSKHMEAAGKSPTTEFPGWDRLSELVSPGVDGSIIVAVGLSNAELHSLNKIAVDSRLNWMYAAFSGGRVVVSSVYQHRKTPCFACARLRRLGSVDDIVSGSILEANFMKDLPVLGTHESAERPVDLILAGVISGKLDGQRSSHLHTIDKSTLEVSMVSLTRLVDCPVCGDE